MNDAGADCGAAADHTTIQAAVVAAAGGGVSRIHVCPGSYAELVRIEGFRRLRLEADPGARLVPPGPVTSGGVIEVVDSHKVDVRGFEIDGAGQFSGAGIHVYGVYFRDTSGSIEGNTISAIRPEPFAPSFAHGILVVDSDPSDDARVKIRIRANRVVDYGQIGVGTSDVASVRIQENVLFGIGPTATEIQLGAIVRSARRGRIVRNEVRNHWYTPFRAAVGLVLEDSSRLRVERNVFGTNYEAISVSGDSHRNRISRNDLAESIFGVSIDGLPGAPAERNEVTRNLIDGFSGAGVTALTVGAATRTLASRNEVTDFATFVDDLGSSTKLSKNSCDGVPCP